MSDETRREEIRARVVARRGLERGSAEFDRAFLLDELSRAEAALAEAVTHLRVIYPERGDGSTMPNYEQTLAARAFLSEHPEAHHAV